ncbi:2-alkyl-3-oxoalkanoate reductase [BD1-7 clade bacterium]|uniref:2-alkyl-3-oxoalkanoate reductase n=1 Tax=BD1-7 clade bacterium TaxID=2029982 RepID=A0A5S9MUZ0_9GAMM|nr:2-alkyl-3-oxoalkanoate reductase [BD1-7 clade bacterium]
MEKRRILITGGCGFIGRNLVNGFADAGHTVTVLDFGGKPFRDDVTFLNMDIRDKDAVIDACAGMDSIIHNASIVLTKQVQKQMVWDVNHGGSLNILEACRVHKIPKLVYISSASAVYEGKDIENGDETLPYSSISQADYADSKIRAERDSLAFAGKGDTAVCAIRPHVVYGPEDNRFIPNIIDRAKAGKLTRAVGNRDKLSDFTYISNLVDGVMLAEEHLTPAGKVDGQAYFITNGEPMAFFDFVEDFVVAMGQPKITKKVPFWLAYSVAACVEGWDMLKGGTLKETGMSRFAIKYMVTHHYYSIDKARRDFGYEPKVSLAEGIQLTVEDLHAKGIYV